MAKIKIDDKTPPAEIHIVGLQKVSPGRYAMVTGTVSNPIIDNITQPLEYSAEGLKKAIMHMLMVIP